MRSEGLWFVSLASLLTFGLGCSSDPAEPDAGALVDAGGRADATPADVGPADAAASDAAPSDAEPADLGSADAGEPLGPVNIDLEAAEPHALLSAYNFFRLKDGQPDYNPELLPYDLNTPLFSDFALKWRAIYVPPGGKIQFDANGIFDFPVGSALVKSFATSRDLRTPNVDVRILETRVLIRYADGWRAFPYLWREDLSDADYFVRGTVIPLEFIDPRGEARSARYLVPQKNQCLACHQQKDEAGTSYLTLIGPTARSLHRDFAYPGGVQNQLTALSERGWLLGLPPLTEIPAAFDFARLSTTSTSALDPTTLEGAARDYLDINCAHCHNPNSTQGVTSQLFLHRASTDQFRLGICKEPGSAGSGSGGLRFDVVPGRPEESILIFRVNSETPGEMMPLLGRSLRDDPGVELLRAWIDLMPEQSCD